MKYTRNCPLLFEITFNFTFNYISRKMTNEDNDRSKCPYLAKDKWVSRKFKKSQFNMNLQSLLIVHLFIANVSIHCSAIFSKEQICIYLQTCLEFDTFNSLKGFVRIRAFQLTPLISRKWCFQGMWGVNMWNICVIHLEMV